MNKIIIGVVLALLSVTALADVFKCTQANGKVEYQSMPCASGSEKALDDSDAQRRKQMAAAAEESRRQDRQTEEEWKMKGSSLDRCASRGESLAVVYFANTSKMLSVDLMPSALLEQSCDKAINPDCRRHCRLGFQHKAKSLLNAQ